MGTIYRNGVPFIGGGGGGTVDTVNGISPDTNKNVQVDVELTQAEYDALPSSKLTDDVNYWIKDGNNNPANNTVMASGVAYDNTDSGMTATNAQDAIDELSSGLLTQEVTEVISTGNRLYAIKMGNIVMLQTTGNGIGITTSGIQIPVDFAPDHLVQIMVPCYTSDWTYCRATIDTSGVITMYGGSSKISASYVCLNVTYALGI